MLKRERDADPAAEKGEVGNGAKLQRVGGQFSERGGDESHGGSKDVSSGQAARKGARQQASGASRQNADVRHEVYKEGRRFKHEGRVDPAEPPPRLQVRIPVEHLQFHNRQVKSRQLWGVDTYTHDSDLVAVLMHCGYVSAAAGVPRDLVADAQVLLEFLPGQRSYPSSHRNGIRSRAWGDYSAGASMRVVECWLRTRSGREEPLQAFPDGSAAVLPTFAPSHLERAIGTRAASSGGARGRAVQEVPMQYNLCNEPWLKYSMQVIADRGLKPSQLTSARLHREVLYLETARERYEVSLEPAAAAAAEQAEPSQAERYRFARCRRALPLPKLRSLGVPQPPAQLELLQTGLQWDDFEWSQQGVCVKGQQLPLLRLHFTGMRPAPAQQ